MSSKEYIENCCKNSNGRLTLIRYDEPVAILSCKLHGHFNIWSVPPFIHVECVKCYANMKNKIRHKNIKDEIKELKKLLENKNV